MRAAKIFVQDLQSNHLLERICSLKVDLFGSLALTGVGHSTPEAILMGIEGEAPETVETTTIGARVRDIHSTCHIRLGGMHSIHFDPKTDLRFHYFTTLVQHPNGMRFSAYDVNGDMVASSEMFSVGGGFIVTERAQPKHGENAFYKEYDTTEVEEARQQQDLVVAALPFTNAQDLLDICEKESMTIAQVVYENELQWRSAQEIKDHCMRIWEVMDTSIRNGCLAKDEYLPGKLNVRRRAPGLYRKLQRGLYGGGAEPASWSSSSSSSTSTTTSVQSSSSSTAHALVERPSKQVLPYRKQKRQLLPALDYLSVYAIAVNEENAAGGRVVTAPTNGSSGLIPAVLKYYLEFFSDHPERDIVEFLLTSAAIGMLFKRGASISAAEMGCQGEVGVACSMAAAAFTAVMGGSMQQVENAAEIGVEHNLGLTCDPIAGLVQIPCIERNALGAVKAVTAAQLALNGDGWHRVTLDQAIETMKQTGIDMQTKYKESSLGGLAINVPVC